MHSCSNHLYKDISIYFKSCSHTVFLVFLERFILQFCVCCYFFLSKGSSSVVKCSAFPFTIIASADFILRTITWQHAATSHIWNSFSLSGLVRDNHFWSWLLHCVWHLEELLLDLVWSPFLRVQQKIWLWYFLGTVFEVLFLSMLKFAKKILHPDI